MPLNYCRIMATIEKNPENKVAMTVREFLGFKIHMKTCVECQAAADRVEAANPRKDRIGPSPTAN